MAQGNESWNVQDKDAKQVLAEEAYDDCTACRVTGRYIYMAHIFVDLLANSGLQDPLRLLDSESTVITRA